MLLTNQIMNFINITIITFLFSFSCCTYAQSDTIRKEAKHSFSLNGYLRTSIAESKGGGTMADFQAPGAATHYRLGNEANTYGEITGNYNYGFKNSNQSVDVILTVSGFKPFGISDSFKLNTLEQFYVKMNKVIGNADVWAGRRYFLRNDYHLVDFYWYNPGQHADVGFGVENIAIKKSNLALALFSFTNKHVKPLTGTIQEKDVNSDILKTYILEAKLTDIPLNKDGNLIFWARAAKRKENAAIGYQSVNGYGFGMAHNQTNLIKGKASNNFQTNIRKGNAMSQNQFTGVPIYETFGNGDVVNYNLKKNFTFEMSDMFLYDDKKNFALNLVAIYRYENRGVNPYLISTEEVIGNGKNINWFSGGFRFLKYFYKHFNLAVEYGFDYVHNQPLKREGELQKLTIAPQLSWDYGFYSRPVLRPFITYASWSKDFKGAVGGGLAPFGDKTNGLTYGIAFEIWF